MAKTRRDLYLALCDKIGGEKGALLRTKLESLRLTGEPKSPLGQKLFGKLDEELSEEVFQTELRGFEKSLANTREWSKWSPVESWDMKN